MHDVIVIGAGFAGCSAAREVRRAGKNPLILEARDRIGGRVWTDDWDGQEIERGGGWVHWFQPHIWSEVLANNLTPEVGPVHDRAYWWVDGELRSGTYADCEEATARGWYAFVEGSHELLPLPYDPLHRADAIARLDGLTIRQHIDELDLDPEAEAILIAEMEGITHGYIDQAGAFTAHRVHALAGHSLPLVQEASGGDITLAEGTIGLITPIWEGAQAETRFNTPVAGIIQHADHVVVTTRAGEEIAARTVVVTVPLNVLHDLDFAPTLSPVKQEAIAYGQASMGIKLFIRVRGPQEFCSGLRPDHPFGYLVTQWVYEDGTQMMIGFGRDHSVCRIEDLAWVQEQVDRIIPGYEVLAVNAHDWLSDEFSQGTWAAHRPHWLTKYQAAMQEPEGRVILASSDIANGWAGFMEGAMESGVRGGRWAAAHC